MAIHSEEVEVSFEVYSGALLTDVPLDPFSPVDAMKARGLDSSREARLEYAQKNGIGGVPFSAPWGEAMLRHLQRNG